LIAIGLVIILFGIIISIISTLNIFVYNEIINDKILGKFQIYSIEYNMTKNIIGIIIGIILVLYGLLTIIFNLQI
jgi:hypothetical protein